MNMTREQAILDCEGPWRFAMKRHLGPLRTPARGVLFEDGTVILRWAGETPSTAVYASFAECERVHGHDGTEFIWNDRRPTAAFVRASNDCVQDSFENCPFASIGGLARRDAPAPPSYVAESDREEYLRGYLTSACAMYGDDWRTREFGWSPALTIGATT